MQKPIVIGSAMLAAVCFSISADISSGPEDLLVSREARRLKTAYASSVHNSEFDISPEQGSD